MGCRNEIIEEDVQSAVASIAPVAETLRGGRVLVTGATGLIGSLLVRMLLAADEEYGLGLQVVAMGRSVERLREKFSSLPANAPLELFAGDVAFPLALEGPVTHIVHGASPTSSRYFVEHPVETIGAAIDGTRNVLTLAREKETKSVVYLSSLEVYGNMGEHDAPIAEDEAGYIDVLSPRSSYSEGKRLCETLCASFASEYDVPVKVARLSQTFGAGVDYDDGRVFAEFMRCALEGRDIVLHSQGRTTRTYCYTADAVAAIVFILARGAMGEAYNVANEATAVSIMDMARLVSEELSDGASDVVVDIPENVASYGYNPEMVVTLSCSKIRKLGWEAKTNLPTMFHRMAACF